MVRVVQWVAICAACFALPFCRLPTAQVQVAKRVPTHLSERVALRGRTKLTPKKGEESPLPSLWDTSQPSQSTWEWAIPIFAFGGTLGFMVAVLASSPVHAATAQDQAVVEDGLSPAEMALQQQCTGFPVTCNKGDGVGQNMMFQPFPGNNLTE